MVPESTNKLGAQEALRPYLGAKEAKAHRALSQISLPTESILYKEGGERCRCPGRINGQWTTTRTSTIEAYLIFVILGMLGTLPHYLGL